jgi:hypothetical protein
MGRRKRGGMEGGGKLNGKADKRRGRENQEGRGKPFKGNQRMDQNGQKMEGKERGGGERTREKYCIYDILEGERR